MTEKSDPVEVMARGIYACELARDENCNSLIIKMGGKQHPSTRIEAYEENAESWRDYARSALAAAEAAGMVMVPKVPTEAMLRAARDHDSSTRDWYEISPEGCENLGLVLWRAMIEAASLAQQEKL